jgi:hypothetical protein
MTFSSSDIQSSGEGKRLHCSKQTDKQTKKIVEMRNKLIWTTRQLLQLGEKEKEKQKEGSRKKFRTS